MPGMHQGGPSVGQFTRSILTSLSELLDASYIIIPLLQPFSRNDSASLESHNMVLTWYSDVKSSPDSGCQVT